MDPGDRDRIEVRGGPAGRVSVIVVSYMTRELLRACLRSVLRQRGVRFEVIVVDNGSSDGSAEMVAGEFPTVTLIASDQNLGFAKANNIAIDRAGGEYVLLLNPDAELSTDSVLEALASFMDRSPAVSAAGCRIVYPDGKIQQSYGNLPSVASALWGGYALGALLARLFPTLNVPGARAPAPEATDIPREVQNLLGACVIVRRDVFRAVGPFDERMFLYFEECDLFQRIRRAGGTLMYVPDATVVHHAGASVVSTPAAVRHYQDSQEHYLRTHCSLRHLGAFHFAVMASALVKVLVLSPACLVGTRADRRRVTRKTSWHWHTFLDYWTRPRSRVGGPEQLPALQGKRQA